MKRACFQFVVVVFLLHTLASAQQPSNGAPALSYEDGRFQNNVYSNECFGFSLAIPEGWLVNDGNASNEIRARHTSRSGLVLLSLKQQKESASGNVIAFHAIVAVPSTMTSQEFVSNEVHRQISINDHWLGQVVRDPYSVEYGTRRFFRSDYQQTSGGDAVRVVYRALIYTRFRGYFIGGMIMARSLDALDQSASLFQNLSFREDERNPKCGMSELSNASEVDPAPNSPLSSSTPPQRARISQGVATGLIVERVQPHYPEDARQARIQGPVVLKAEIDKNGDVQDLTPISGDPLLVTAAIEAVKQWKYKPFLLNGQPVAVETQVTVNFQLLAH